MEGTEAKTTRERDVPYSVAKLETSMDELEKMATDLINRLLVVSRNEPPVEAKVSEAILGTAKCELACRIDTINQNTRKVLDKIGSALSLLEI